MRYDDIVIGAGHNGLTAAAYLARAGRRVLVLDKGQDVGGATVSARVFPGVDARLSRYSYLVSLLPQRIRSDLELDLRLIRRRWSSYTPLPGAPGRGLLVEATDERASRARFREVTGSDEPYAAWRRFYERVGRLAQRVFPTMLEPLLAADSMRARVDDDELFDTLTTRPLADLLEPLTEDDTIRGIIATDALIGTFASLSGPDLRANVCLLYHLVGGGTGDWDVPVGGMGALTVALARAAADAGATIRTDTEVTAVDPASGEVTWRGGRASAGSLVAGCAPSTLAALLEAAGAAPVPTERDIEGCQLKVNMVLRRLPRLLDAGVDPAAAFAGTFHVNEGYGQLEAAYAAARSGRLPDPVPCEVYCHTLSDRSILGPALADSPAQTLTLFGLHLPARLFLDDPDGTRAAALDATLRSLDSVLGEPIRDVLAVDADGRPCLEVTTPLDLEQSLGLPGGNIFHRSLQWPWAETPAEVGTWGVETPHSNLALASAGARRGGGVSGIPGHNAARAVLQRAG